MEQERSRQGETINKFTGKCSKQKKLYNNTPINAIVNTVSNISYRQLLEAYVTS